MDSQLFLNNDIIQATNLHYDNIEDCKFVAPENWNFNIQKTSPAVDAGTSFAFMSIFPMEPNKQYKHPTDTTNRIIIGNNIDVGAYELVNPTSVDTGDNINKKYRLYPNPVNDLLNIDDIDNLSTNLLIYDLSGKLVKTLYFGSQKDISDIPTGCYFLITENDKNTCIYFIKQ